MRKDSGKHKILMRDRRRSRIRGKISGTAARPRLSVFRSAKSVALQLVDDESGKTLLAQSQEKKGKKTKTELAFGAGKALAEKAKAKHITKIVYDRGGYAYHGRIKAVADGARAGGLEF